MDNLFSWSYGGLIWGQKWTHTKIDRFTKNGPKSSILIFLSYRIFIEYYIIKKC
jgi:hypothetical protein